MKTREWFANTLWSAILLLLFAGVALGEPRTNYKKWLNEEVVWIIGKQEKKTFKRLSSDDQRDAFIAQFWKDRDPTPDTAQNEYRDEHYRRLEHAKETFRENSPGWRTDRGRVYIIHGPPLARRQFADQEEWDYASNPYGRYYKGQATLVFVKGGRDQSFTTGPPLIIDPDPVAGGSRQSEIQGYTDRYRLVQVRPLGAGSGTNAQYVSDYLRSPGNYLEDLKRQGRQPSPKTRRDP